ncbi:hypothetical protein [Actinomadura rupiterrae]|uniref:hypothetical protein n=1 Tax=Actinomadura rupiterrae TaxID=559627 RepID=UPI0020A3ACD8|nr:hypothetical protein [Actinomadura rupiterrae]MCP2343028.1 hypothetical protein [Actinomadura rupiterrae]
MRIPRTAVLSLAFALLGLGQAAAPALAAATTPSSPSGTSGPSGPSSPSGTVAAATVNQTTEPVYFVHGWKLGNSGDCQNDWRDAQGVFRNAGLRGPFITWGYYKFDAHCTRKVNGDHNTRVQELGRLFAWDVYNNYSRHGKYVNVVAHSMGGLITDAALVGTHKYAGHGWPPYLRIRNVATLSTPYYGGNYAYACSPWQQQCSDMSAGSGFLRWLRTYQNPQGAGGTDWTMIGSQDDKTVDYRSAAGIKPTPMTSRHKVYFYAGQHLSHSSINHVGTGRSWHVWYSNDWGANPWQIRTGGAPLVYAANAIWSTAY